MLKLVLEKHFISLQKVIESSKMLEREGEQSYLYLFYLLNLVFCQKKNQGHWWKNIKKCAARQVLLYQLLKAKELLDKIPNSLLPLLLKLQIGPCLFLPSPSISIKPPFFQARDFKGILKPILDHILPFFNEIRKRVEEKNQ